MARVTDAEVREIVDITTSEISDLTPFITIANQMVTEVCTDSSYTDDRLKEIERWLAAHFSRIRVNQAASEKAGSVAQSYQYKVDLNLACTMYGQQAMILDTAGGLAQLNKQATTGKKTFTPSVFWAGTEDTSSETS